MTTSLPNFSQLKHREHEITRPKMATWWKFSGLIFNARDLMLGLYVVLDIQVLLIFFCTCTVHSFFSAKFQTFEKKNFLNSCGSYAVFYFHQTFFEDTRGTGGCCSGAVTRRFGREHVILNFAKIEKFPIYMHCAIYSVWRHKYYN